MKAHRKRYAGGTGARHIGSIRWSLGNDILRTGPEAPTGICGDEHFVLHACKYSREVFVVTSVLFGC